MAKGGHERWFSFHNTVIRGFDGSISGVLFSAEDITDRRQVAETLRQYEHIVSSTSDMMALLDVDYTYLAANIAYVKAFGLSQREIIGKAVHEVFGQQFFEDIIKENADICLAGKEIKYQQWFDFPTGKKFMEIHYYPYRAEDNMIKGFVVNGRDITSDKKAEQQIHKHQEQLQALTSELSLAEARSQERIATILHDGVCQEMAISIMKLDTIRNTVKDDDINSGIIEATSFISNALWQSQALTYDLNFISYLNRFGFARAIGNWIEQRLQNQHGIKVEFVDDELDKPLSEDIGVLLFQATRELLINTIKHSKADQVKVFLQRKGKMIEIAVQDNGNGFDVSRIGSVAPRSTGGGFGLLSVKERLNYCGGKMDIESSASSGTKIILSAHLVLDGISKKSNITQYIKENMSTGSRQDTLT